MTAERTTLAIARGVLLGTFVGDALGARWEGAEAVDEAGARRRFDESLSARLLRYTDDTQLTLALAEHLCDEPHVEPVALAGTMRRHFEGHRGYARGMFGIVAAWDRGLSPDEAATSVFPEGSFGNGAAMRAAPVGVVWRHDISELVAVAHRQAAITHAHPVGKDAAAAQAHAVARAALSGRFGVDDIAAIATAASTEDLRKTLRIAAETAERHLAAPISYEEVAATVGTGVLADQSVPAALWVAAVAESFSDAVILSLGLGGDVDTIAAMACAIVGAAATGDALPAEWLERLEGEGRGRRYAEELAVHLAEVADHVAGTSDVSN